MSMSVSNELRLSLLSVQAQFTHAMTATLSSVSLQQMWPGAKILSNAGATGVSNNDLAPRMQIART